MVDPLAGSSWSAPGTVAGFAQSPPNDNLMRFAAAELPRSRSARLLDLGCGAGRNAVPLARPGWDVVGIDLSWPMLSAAARVARPGAALFVFTFSRNTVPPQAAPVPGETFVFTQFSGQPQCFLTGTELIAELNAVGFAPEPGFPMREYNRPQPGLLASPSVPVIYEGVFRAARG